MIDLFAQLSKGWKWQILHFQDAVQGKIPDMSATPEVRNLVAYVEPWRP
jgi:hypothetical protein